MRKRNCFFSILVALFLACLLTAPSLICAQPRTHVVVKGDTLWDICEAYYGDPTLWPKLWQMNPFITNPHLLDPGDVVTLLEEVPIKEEKEIPVKEIAKPVPALKGIDVSGLTNVKGLGYIIHEEVEAWGHLLVSESGKILLAEGEHVYVRFHDREGIKPGDKFSICKSSPLLKHPITGQSFGYVLSILGSLVIEKPVGVGYAQGEYYKKKDMYRAEILESYRELHVGDLLIPYEPVAPCVQPLSTDQPLIGNIIAAQDELQLIGPQNIVYIDQGLDQGVRRGHLFQVVKTHLIPDPDVGALSIVNRAKVILPDIPIGTIMVLESRPRTASAVVLSSKEEIPSGTYIKGLSWVEAPESIARIDKCPVE